LEFILLSDEKHLNLRRKGEPIMANHQTDVDLARKHYEEKLKITLGPYEMKETMNDPMTKGKYLVIDVRNHDSYVQEHVPGAINIPEDELEDRIDEIPRNGKDIIVYCWTVVCHLAAHAGLTLARHGIVGREMEGGIAEWKNYEFPVESGEMAKVST
jgi:rhodanese-related sulfurtransferase